MKTRFALVLMLLGLSLTVFAAPVAASMPEQINVVTEECPICSFDTASYSGPLNQAEVEGLLMALNDEYHAWAVYDRVIADFGEVQPFVNIRQAEARHIQALLELFDAYQVPVPDNVWQGSVSSYPTVEAACAAGVDAEIANVDLYTTLFDTTQRLDVLYVYGQLQTASQEKHLPAFERCVSR